MALLIDTQVILWLEDKPKVIPTSVSDKIYTESEVYFSLVSVWEIAIKAKTGKLNIGKPLPDFIADLQATYLFRLLPITLPHIYFTQQLDLHHHDPFDRLIIAQSLFEQMPVVSSDAALDAYGITRIWK